jgi:hypothetical protein
LEHALLYEEQHSKATPTDVICWRDIAASSRRSTLYQKKITDFVKKKKDNLYMCKLQYSVNFRLNKYHFLWLFVSHPVRINRNFGLARLYCNATIKTQHYYFVFGWSRVKISTRRPTILTEVSLQANTDIQSGPKVFDQFYNSIKNYKKCETNFI